jgi:AcrR family transcriptional regulator
VDLRHRFGDHLGLLVFLEADQPHLAADSGLLVAAERGVRRIPDAAVDADGASLYNYFATKRELLKATAQSIEELTLPRLRAAAQGPADVVDRLDALLDESDRLMREYPYLAAFERAMRAESDDSNRAGVQAIRTLIAEIIDDAGGSGALAVDVDAEAVVDVLFALARGLTERAQAPHPSQDTLATAKRLIRGTLFRSP